MDNVTLGMIKRICDIILNHPTVTEELDSLALRVAYQQDIFDANTEVILPIRYYAGNVKPLNEVISKDEFQKNREKYVGNRSKTRKELLNALT